MKTRPHSPASQPRKRETPDAPSADTSAPVPEPENIVLRIPARKLRGPGGTRRIQITLIIDEAAPGDDDAGDDSHHHGSLW